jgi:hypothetical protein
MMNPSSAGVGVLTPGSICLPCQLVHMRPGTEILSEYNQLTSVAPDIVITPVSALRMLKTGSQPRFCQRHEWTWRVLEQISPFGTPCSWFGCVRLGHVCVRHHYLECLGNQNSTTGGRSRFRVRYLPYCETVSTHDPRNTVSTAATGSLTVVSLAQDGTEMGF